MQVLRMGRALLEDHAMNNHQIPAAPVGEPFVDAREAAYTLNLPMYYLTNAAQRTRLRIPHYRIGRMVRFKLSELTAWQQRFGTPRTETSAEEVSDE
jgi:hypothetical protein